jgi:hypothetical protein
MLPYSQRLSKIRKDTQRYGAGRARKASRSVVRTSVFADLQGLNVAECYVFVERVFGLHLIVSHYPHERGRKKTPKL